MDRLLAMRVFNRVVETGSFTRAADTLDMPKPTVTKLIQQLEAHLRVKLLNRTTRKVIVTPDGATYYERAQRVLADVDEMEATLSASRAAPRGRLRIDVGAAMARFMLIPALADFHARYPDVQIDLGVGDRPVDLIADNVDCVIRGGTITDQSLVARRLATLPCITAASPAYLAKHGTPAHPDALQPGGGHRMVPFFSALTGRAYPADFRRGDERIELHGDYVIAVNDSNAYLGAAVAGLGIVQAPTMMLADALADGSLVRVLDDWETDGLPIHLVYPPNRHIGVKLRVFVDWIAERFAQLG